MVAALRLLAVILGATGLGFALRHVLLPHPTPRQTEALDGASVLAFSVIVVGLMAALVRFQWALVVDLGFKPVLEADAQTGETLNESAATLALSAIARRRSTPNERFVLLSG